MHLKYALIYNSRKTPDFDTILTDDFDIFDEILSERDMILKLKNKQLQFAHLWVFDDDLVNKKRSFRSIPKHLITVGPVV